MTVSNKPTLAITMGDPAGIGPEVIVGAWCDERVHALARLVVIGHPEILLRAARLLNRDLDVVEAHLPRSDGGPAAGPTKMVCIRSSGDDVLNLSTGRVDARAGEAAFRAVIRAAELALAGEVDGVVTAPLSKAALHAAGHMYPGHTELLAEICGVSEFAMMLYLPPGPVVCAPAGLGVAHVTLHQSLRSVFADLKPDAILCEMPPGRRRHAPFGCLAATIGRVRTQSACRRGGTIWRRGGNGHSAGGRSGAACRHQCFGPLSDRHANAASTRRRIRCCCCYVSRPGAYCAEAAGNARGS